MQARVFAIADADGLHARPAAALLKKAQELGVRLLVRNTQNDWVDAGVMNLLLAGAKKTSVELAVEGGNEAAALDALERLLAI